MANKPIGADWRITDELPWWQWLKETPVAILEENELPAWKDPGQVIQALKDMGADHIRYPAICWGAHFYDHSNFLPKAAGIEPDSDYFGSIVKACRENGIKVMAYCHYGVLYRELEQIHPEWLARKADGTPEDWNRIHRKVCLSSRNFQSAMRGAIEEIIEKYHPDSIYLDGPAWYCPTCFCESCRTRWKAKYGEDMPNVLRYEDGSHWKFTQIRDESYQETLSMIHELTLKHNIPVQINTHMHTEYAHRHGNMPLAMADHCEGANTTEVHRPDRFIGIFQSAKLGEAHKRVSMAYCPPGPFETMRTFDLDETLVTGMAYVMHGGTPMEEPVSSYFHNSKGSAKMRELNDVIRAHRDIYYRTQPVREFAMVYPHGGIDRFSEAQQDHFNHLFGSTFEALTHAGVHFDCIYDVQISRERLQGYRMLMLPVSVYMDEEQQQIIREFVENGGVIIAGPELGMYTAEGKRTGKLALEDVLGVTFEKFNPPEPVRTREYRESSLLHGFNRVPEAYVKSECGLCGDLVPMSDAVVGIPNLDRYVFYTYVKPEGAEVLADMFLPADGMFGTPLTFPFGKPPAVTMNRFGKGRAYYLSCEIGFMYERRGLPEQRELLKNIVLHALDHKPVLAMDAPPSVIANLVEDVKGRYLHLLNYTGSMLEKSRTIEWVAPIDGFRVTVRVPKKVASVKAVFPDTDLAFEQNGEEVTFTIPKLHIYQSIALIYA